MAVLEDMTAAFEADERDLKHVSRSHVEAWIAARGGRDVAAEFIKRIVSRGLWHPWPGRKKHRLVVTTGPRKSGYRTSDHELETVTLNASSLLEVLLRVLLVLLIPLYVYAQHQVGPIFLAALAIAILAGIPYSYVTAQSLRRYFKPDEVELRDTELVCLREKVPSRRIPHREILYVDVGHHMDKTVRTARKADGEKFGLLSALSLTNTYAVYAMTTENEVIILSDCLDENAAKAAAMYLESKLGLIGERRVRVAEAETPVEEESVAAQAEAEAEAPRSQTIREDERA